MKTRLPVRKHQGAADPHSSDVTREGLAMNATHPCSVQGCDGTATSRGWCHTHYTRWHANGDVRADVPIRRGRRVCDVDGCDRPHQARGYCKLHWDFWRRYGDPLLREVVLNSVGYAAAHDRVRVARGRASDQQCVPCGAPAQDWSYRHDDPDEKSENRGRRGAVPYSLNPAHYDPMCRTCHRRTDAFRHKTACPSGHAYTQYRRVTPKGQAYCSECQRLRYQRTRRAHKVTVT